MKVPEITKSPMVISRDTLATILPYLAWMVLMMCLPRTAVAYAVRVAVTAGLLVWPLMRAWSSRTRHSDGIREAGGVTFRGIIEALFAGVVVCAFWIYPEAIDWYRRFFILGGIASVETSPYDPAVCGWPLAWTRLLGSALVIAPAEELFFRSFLYRRLQATNWRSIKLATLDISAFCWTVGLFALEHDRWLAAIFAGVIYGIVAMRQGILAAMIAHGCTNLLLGAHVLYHGAWIFW